MIGIDKYRGCLIGGAVGDALGYAVEFYSVEQIFKKYGEKGISEYELSHGIAQISDDTQMTLFTANGLLYGTTRGMMRGIMARYPDYISHCYLDWLKTQTQNYSDTFEGLCSWLINVPEMYNSRAPGNTCLSAVEQGANGTIEKPINNSKGCGGIMRVAPIGLYFTGERCSQDKIDMIGAETAALTHGHELGYIPAAAFVHIIHLLSHNEDITVLSAVQDSLSSMQTLFQNTKHIDDFLSLMNRAVELASSNIDDLEAIQELGEGWVAEETLAIAVYCTLKYAEDFEKAIIAAVNHSGDSDSTGAVTGNIIGAHLGYDSIPKKYIENLEFHDIIIEFSDDLYNDCKISEYGEYQDEVWEQKYIYIDYMKNKK